MTARKTATEGFVLTCTLCILLGLSATVSAATVSPIQVRNVSAIPVITLSPAIAPALNPVILVTLKPPTTVQLTGIMAIESIPSGASLFIDGTSTGTTPYITRTIAAGEHRMTLKMPGYEDYITTVTVPGGGSIKGVYTMVAAAEAPLLTKTGIMVIESIPSAALFYIDGKLAGTTPYSSRTTPAGDHLVMLQKSGYADLHSIAAIPAGGEFHEQYTLSCNILSVSSVPSGASLSINGVLTGTSPVTIREIPAGDHVVSLSMAGYEDFTRTVTVPPGVEVNMAATLLPVTQGYNTSSVPLPVSGTTPIPAGREIITAIPSTTTVPVPARITPEEIDRRQPETCTVYYLGSGDLKTTSDGKLNCTTVIRTDDHITALQILKGTRIVDAEKRPVQKIDITPADPSEIPSVISPDGSRWTGHAYHYLPDHASFDPPVLVSFTISQKEWDRSDPANLTIKATTDEGQGWEDLPLTIDPATRTISAQARHFSIIGLFLSSPAASPLRTAHPEDIVRQATGTRQVSLPLSPLIPDKYAPLAAVVTGVMLSLIGTLVSGSATFSRLWEKVLELSKKFSGYQTIRKINVTEIEKRGLRPSGNLTEVLFGLSSREILVTGISALVFAGAFILQDRLDLKIITVFIFACVGGIATILRDLAQKFVAYRKGCITEYQFWSLGTIIMFSTAWLFGNVFAKPSRTLIRSEQKFSPEDAALIKLAGPLMSMGVAIVSLFLIPLGGLFVIAGSAGFAMNLLNCVFSLVPVTPNEGVDIYAWNKLVWAAVFLPMIAFYLYIYIQL